MRSSHSAAPLLPHDADIAEVGPAERIQRRSSLDTFVIPGRTRLPSGKVDRLETMDHQIAASLLNPEAHKPPKQHSFRVAKSSWLTSKNKKSPVSKERARSTEAAGDYAPPAEHMNKPKSQSQRNPPIYNGLPFTIIPPEDPRHQAVVRHQAREYLLQRNRQDRSKNHSYMHDDRELGIAYLRRTREDQGSPAQLQEHPLRPDDDELRILSGRSQSDGSRVTSTTWSTVSKRIFSSSSDKTQNRGSSKSIEEFNGLAAKYGLLQFAPPSEIASTGHDVHTKVKSKTHHNWFARKVLRRSTPLTYQVKVKAKQNPITRRTSISSISSLLEREHKDLLKDKSLEEVGRLGGLSILQLPQDFAVDKLTLPTCISATATYLVQHGLNAPGILRVPGQTYTVNALYDYYAHRYASASDADLVQQTVGSGLLPAHIQYTVHDVASVFKKIILGLPGGLLGSASLFAAFRSVAQSLRHDPQLSNAEFTSLKARLIALAISSVTSTFRISLICAVLGLAAFLGHEAEQAIARNRENNEPLSAELMSYQALGVVLGPLLLGDLTCDPAMAIGLSDPAPLPVPNSPNKTPKEKRMTMAPNKLDLQADFLAQVEHAKSTAVVTQMLISIWKDVIKQLREIDAERLRSSRLAKEQTSQSMRSQLTLESSDEDILHDILRRRGLPGNFEGSVEVKQRLTVPSSSPASSRGLRASSSWIGDPIQESQEPVVVDGLSRHSSRPPWDILYESGEHTYDSGHGLDLLESPATAGSYRDMSGQTVHSRPLADSSRDFSGPTVLSTTSSMIAGRSEPKGQLSSNASEVTDDAMEQMSKGTLFMRPPEIFGFEEMERSFNPNLGGFDTTTQQHVAKHKDNPIQEEISQSEGVTEDNLQRRAEGATNSKYMEMLQEPHTLAQAPPLSSTDLPCERSKSQSHFPVRKSSLAQVRRSSSSHMLRTDASGQNGSNIYHSDKPRMPETPEVAEVNDRFMDTNKVFARSRRNSVKMMAQKFADVERATRAEVQKKDAIMPKAYGYIKPLPPMDEAQVSETSQGKMNEKSPEKSMESSIGRKDSLKPASIPLPCSPGTIFDDNLPLPRGRIQVTNEISNIQPASDSERDSFEKETMIPKPMQSHGSPRQSSRSPSPTKLHSPPRSPSTPKSASHTKPPSHSKLPSPVKPVSPNRLYVHKRPSVFNLVSDNKDTDNIRKIATTPFTPIPPLFPVSNPELNRRTTGQNLAPHSQPFKSTPTRSLTAYSADSLRRLRAAMEEPPIAEHVVRLTSPRPAEQQSKNYVNSSTTTTDDTFPQTQSGSEKSTSTNTANKTLYAEIQRLQRQIAAKSEETAAANRQLAIEKAAPRTGTAQLNHEVRKARREAETWRTRAVWAERRLEGVGVRVGVEWEEYVKKSGGDKVGEDISTLDGSWDVRGSGYGSEDKGEKGDEEVN